MIEFTPHEYQQKAIKTLLCQAGAGLFLDPGMGKTVVSLAAFDILKKEGMAKTMLVIAPLKPAYDTWPREPKKWRQYAHLNVSVLHGAKKKDRLGDRVDIHVINPEGLTWLFNQPNRPSWDILCVDESTKFKSSTSKRFKLLKKHLPEFSRRWILTGTPAPNGLMDLFGQAYIMDSGEALGKFITHYRTKYFYQTGFGGYTWAPFEHSMGDIVTAIGDKVLKLDAEDYLDMPELMVVDRPIHLDLKSFDMYKQVQNEFIYALGAGNVVAANAAAAGTKCRQIANGAVYDEDGNTIHIHDHKLDALQEIVEETNGHPLLILYEFNHDRERIEALLGKDCVCITGVTGPKLEAITNRFNKGGLPYLLAHPSSTHGMNIQGNCYHMVWFGITWNLENYIQAVWRLYRQGQTSKMVLVYHLVAENTLDERVVKVLNHKEQNQSSFEDMLNEYRSYAFE
jgi:superfamily II DNA or RNA helicase